MQYLTFVGGRTGGDDRTVEQQVLEVRYSWTQAINGCRHQFIAKFQFF
jgi:hypothetical protein